MPPDVDRKFLCRLDELEDPGSRGFEARDVGTPWDFFIVRRNQSVYAYQNNCPHTGAPLDWMPHRFLDPDGVFIQCSMHGALFGIEDGRCLRGPCLGQPLTALQVQVVGGRITLLRSEK